MATKKNTSRKRSQRKQPPVTGSPITIGGGGGKKYKRGNVSCDFDHGDYPEPSGGPGRKRFQNLDLHMQSLKIWANGHPVDLTPFLGDDGDCRVKVSCEGFDNDLTIFGKPMGVEFDTRTYPQSGDVHTNPDVRGFIKEVDVNAPKFSFRKEFQEGDRCRVVADIV